MNLISLVDIRKSLLNSPHYQNIPQATLCSLCFMLLFVAINSAQNIQSQLLEDDGYGKLGFYSNAVISLALAFGSIIASRIVS